MDGAIEFDNVTFKFHGSTVLEDISFKVEPGQTVAIVGQTGSGKSTLTQLVSRTYDVNAGRVLVDGIDVREWNLDRLRSQMGKIEQDIFLFSRSVGENIAFGVQDAAQAEIEEAAREAQAHDFILTFNDGYDSEIGERGVTLSGGQRQRLALARAFLRQPKILILDDSTSAIDSATEDEIQKAMRRAQEGRTTILITHRLSQIRWADRIVVLEKGRVIANGSHDDLLQTSEHYRRIFARYDTAESPVGQLNGHGRQTVGFIMDGLEAESYDRSYTDWALVKRILLYFKPHFWKMSVVAGVVFLSSLMDLVLPVVVSRSMDELQFSPDTFRPCRHHNLAGGGGQYGLGRQLDPAMALGGSRRRCHPGYARRRLQRCHRAGYVLLRSIRDRQDRKPRPL